MLKNLWEKICNILTPKLDTVTVDIRKIASEEYASILHRTRRSASLAQLLETRKEIRKLQQYLIEHNEEVWGRKLVIDLHLYWKAKYEYWKKKTRGK